MGRGSCGGFPRLYAAASLKRRPARSAQPLPRRRFSAALCRGLIEAMPASGGTPRLAMGFPRLYAAASLKLAAGRAVGEGHRRVFRGFMPRPH